MRQDKGSLALLLYLMCLIDGTGENPLLQQNTLHRTTLSNGLKPDFCLHNDQLCLAFEMVTPLLLELTKVTLVFGGNGYITSCILSYPREDTEKQDVILFLLQIAAFLQKCIPDFYLQRNLFLSLDNKGIDYYVKCNWFPGAVRYFVTYAGQPLNVTDLEGSSTLLATYNTLYISRTISSESEMWPVKLLSNCPFCRSGEPDIILKNLWSPTGGFKWKSDGSLFPELFFDCNGHKLRGVALPVPPFIDYTEGNATHPIVLKDCVDREIMRATSEFCNFTFDIYESADGQWGYQLSNGSFTGVLGEVERYLADFSLGIALSAEREQVTDFTIDYFTEPLTFTTSKPKPLPQWLSLVRPYQNYVWICFLVAVFAAGPTYWLILRSSGYSSSILRAAFIMFATLLSQSCHWPKRTSVRLFSIFWILFSMVATMSYLSNLTAFMTVPVLSPTVDSLEELSSPFSPFAWGIVDQGAADYQLFKTSQVPVYQRIFRGLTFSPSAVEGVQKAVDEQFAFISWRTYLRGIIASHFTEKNGYTPVYLAKGSFYPVNIAYALQKGSPLKRCFDVVLRRLVEGGFVETWLTNLMQKNALESQRKKRDESTSREEKNGEAEGALSLKVHHLQGVFLIYVVGLMLSFVLLISEMISYATMKKKTGYLST